MWGVFEEVNEVHVSPIDENLYMKEPHTLDVFCICNPEYKIIAEAEHEKLLVIHTIEN